MIKYRIIAENKYSVSEACRIAEFCKNISKTLRKQDNFNTFLKTVLWKTERIHKKFYRNFIFYENL